MQNVHNQGDLRQRSSSRPFMIDSLMLELLVLIFQDLRGRRKHSVKLAYRKEAILEQQE